jgi:hypothetical protein
MSNKQFVVNFIFVKIQLSISKFKLYILNFINLIYFVDWKYYYDKFEMLTIS